jgi:ABC-type uncharacterized transport system involved in gliding motility auxiliary subunit
LGAERCVFDDEECQFRWLPELDEEWMTERERERRIHERRLRQQRAMQVRFNEELPRQREIPLQRENAPPEPVHKEPVDNGTEPEPFLIENGTDDENNASLDHTQGEAEDTTTEDTRTSTRSRRRVKKNPRFFGDVWMNYQYGRRPKQKIQTSVFNGQYINSSIGATL